MMHRSLSTAALALGVTLLSSCQADRGSEVAAAAGGGQGLGLFAQNALKKCLAKWGQHPFSQSQIANARRIDASVTVQGEGATLTDAVTTSAPELVLIGAAVNVSGTAKYQLLNPNGWYCLQTAVNVNATTLVDLACTARLSDTKTGVDVGSSGDQLGSVGVNVGSNVKVTRVGCPSLPE